MQSDVLPTIAVNAIDEQRTLLNSVSQNIWEHPEVALEEYHAHEVLCKFLTDNGFAVEQNFVLPTGFRATSIPEKRNSCPHVAVLCEYDALPKIGHACGHNLIAEVGIATAIGIKAALESSETPIGQLTVLGTPTEESYGGKIDFVNARVFDNVDFAVMAHPGPYNISAPSYLARQWIVVKYRGNAAHSSSNPWDGVNALNAAVSAYNNISHLRQQLKPMCQVSGIINKGGDAPNIIPESTELTFDLRAPTSKDLNEMKRKAINCFEAAATATGCQVEIIPEERYYKDLVNDKILVQSFEKNASQLGVTFEPSERFATVPWGSTDFGNVSHVVPGIQPEFYIGTDTFYHHKDFTNATGNDIAQEYAIIQAKALALTALDIFTNSELFDEMKKQFQTKTEQAS